MGFEDEEEAALFVGLVVDVEDDGDDFFFCEEEAREMEKGFGFGLWSRSSEAIAATGVEYRSLGQRGDENRTRRKGERKEKKQGDSELCYLACHWILGGV